MAYIHVIQGIYFQGICSAEALQHKKSPGPFEAWVCTLFAGPELSWRQIALHAEVIRRLLKRFQQFGLGLKEHLIFIIAKLLLFFGPNW